MPEKRPTPEQRRMEYLAKIDSPAQAVVAGGTNERASIPGVPGRGEEEEHGLQLFGKHVVYAEPVAVVLRDAVTLDTAERLLGCDRRELHRSVLAGYLPAVKLGPATAPYLVRLRDVAWWMLQKGLSSRSRLQNQAERRKGDPNTGYVGFPAWLVSRIEAIHPGASDGAVADPTKVRRLVNRGGRPRQEPTPPGPPGEPLPAVPGGEIPENGKSRAGASDHAPTPIEIAPPLPSRQERAKLPKWHPLWVRPEG